MFNEKIEIEIQKLNCKENRIVDYIFSNSYFKRSNQYSSTVSEYKETIVFENTGLKFILLFIVGFVTLILGLISIEKNTNWFCFLFFLFLELCIFYYYNKKRKSIIKVNDYGIEINSSLYKWKDIYDYGFLITPSTKTESYCLVVFLNNEKSISFDLFDFNNLDEIIETMNFFRNKSNSINL